MKTAFLLLSFLCAPLCLFAETFPEISSVFDGSETLKNAQFSAKPHPFRAGVVPVQKVSLS